MESDATDEVVLFSLLPQVVWRLVLESMEPHDELLEACSKAIPLFHHMLEKRGRVLVYPTILPHDIRDKISEDIRNDKFSFLWNVLMMKSPGLATLHINLSSPLFCILSLFLERRWETMETVSISHSNITSAENVLRLSKMRNLRVLKLIRRVSNVDDRISFTVDRPVYDVLPALESLTLSLGGKDQWPDLLGCSEQNQNQVCPAVRHLRLIDYRWLNFKTPHQALVTLEKALKLFPNLVDVEIPARRGAEVVFQAKNLKCLTLTKDHGASDKHSFDTFLTGYSRETCAGILKKINSKRRNKLIWGELEGTPERGNNITNLHALQILRIKCSFATLGPTLVTFAELIKLKSLRIWEFCGHKPEYIPKNILDGKMTAGYKISWTKC